MAAIRERRNAGGKITGYQAQVRIQGVPPQTETFPTRTAAKRWANKTEDAIRDRRFFKTSQSNQRTLAEAIQKFILEELPKLEKQRRDLSSHLKEWDKSCGAYYLSELTPDVLSAVRTKMLATKTVRKTLPAPATVVRKMASLAAVLKVARQNWEWMEKDPLSRMTPVKFKNERQRYLDEDERTRMLTACQASPHPYIHLVVMIALSTGMRLGEIMNLSWANVTVQQDFGQFHLPTSKNNQPRAVPLAGKALVMMREFKGAKTKHKGLLFPSANPKVEGPTDIRKAWKAVLRAARIEDFRFHDLRHSAASYYIMNGASTREVAEILGHKTLSMVQRYTHLSPTHLTALAEKMNAKFLS